MAGKDVACNKNRKDAVCPPLHHQPNELDQWSTPWTQDNPTVTEKVTNTHAKFVFPEWINTGDLCIKADVLSVCI